MTAMIMLRPHAHKQLRKTPLKRGESGVIKLSHSGYESLPLRGCFDCSLVKVGVGNLSLNGSYLRNLWEYLSYLKQLSKTIKIIN